MKVKWIAIVAVVVVVVAAAVGFGAYSYGKNVGQTQALAARASFFQARGIGGGTAGQGAGAGGAAAFNPNNFANGQVKQINGNTVELSTATEVLKVKLSDQTRIQKTVSGAPGDIQPGERITVMGNRASDGTLEAQNVQIGGGFRGPGAPGGQNASGAPGSQGASAAPASQSTQ